MQYVISPTNPFWKSNPMMIHDTSKTKIIATIGPATESDQKLRELIYAGIDVCRLNFSHGTYDDHQKVIDSIRNANKEMGTHVAILGDLQGPKIRLGNMQNEATVIHDGDEIKITNRECLSTDKILYVSYPDLPKDIRPGNSILIDDGKIKLTVLSTDSESEIVAKVIHGGPLHSKKGVNLPDTRISISGLTEKDRKDVAFILEHDLDWIALSFVRKANDILELKKMIREKDKAAKVIAKIEKPEALKDIDGIIEAADAVMVARGDLGVEVSYDRVPYIQKLIVQKCIHKSTPVIIATQMLESMMSNFRPTRAEANDVANAVFDCADTVMLSGETSVGNYPIESINSMQQIIDFAEGKEFVHKHEHLPDIGSNTYIPDSVCFNACKMADQSGAKIIIAFVSAVESAFRLASNRPQAPICIFTYDWKIIHQLSLVWGVWAFYIDKELGVDNSFEYSINVLKEKSFLKDGDMVVKVSSLPLFDPEGLNTIKLSCV